MKPYNGHRSWNAWNVSLWISNDENLYGFALECIAAGQGRLHQMVNVFMGAIGGTRTPDGAIYNTISVRSALKGLMEE